MTPDQIKALRERLGMSLREIAPLVGVSHSAWCLWESGKRKPDARSVILLRILAEGSVTSATAADPESPAPP